MKTIARWITACVFLLCVRVPCLAVNQFDASRAFSPLMVLRQMGYVVVLGVAVMAVSLLIRYLWIHSSR